MLPTPVPEIQRQNLANTILMLKALNINDLLHFDFMDVPPSTAMLSAMEELYALSALDEEGLLTRRKYFLCSFSLFRGFTTVLLSWKLQRPFRASILAHVSHIAAKLLKKATLTANFTSWTTDVRLPHGASAREVSPGLYPTRMQRGATHHRCNA